MNKLKQFDERWNRRLDKVPLVGNVNRWCDRHPLGMTAWSFVIGALIGLIWFLVTLML
jgi:hypothetical protein